MFWVETVMSKVERSSLSPHLYLCLSWNREESMMFRVEKCKKSNSFFGQYTDCALFRAAADWSKLMAIFYVR
jgi:hypothetical protein